MVRPPSVKPWCPGGRTDGKAPLRSIRTVPRKSPTPNPNCPAHQPRGLLCQVTVGYQPIKTIPIPRRQADSSRTSPWALLTLPPTAILRGARRLRRFTVRKARRPRISSPATRSFMRPEGRASRAGSGCARHLEPSRIPPRPSVVPWSGPFSFQFSAFQLLFPPASPASS